MPLTRIDSAFLDLDAIGGIDFDVQSGVPTLSVDATTHRVGIGTDNPSVKLDVYAGSLTVGSHYVATTGTDYKITLKSVGVANNNNYTGQIGLAGGGVQPSDSSLTFSTQLWNGITYVVTEKFRVTGAGNVGIGTDNPIKKLDVYNGSTDSDTLRLYNEEVGINMGTWGTGSSYPRTVTINGTRFDNGSFTKLRIGGQAGIEFAVDLNNVRAVIDSNGNVGIGETSPSSKFEIVSGDTASVVSGIKLKNDSTSDSGPGSSIDFVVDGVNDVTIAQIIGQRTSANYHQGSLQFLTRDSDGGGLLERLRITSGGNVGIGTDNPGQKLHIKQGSIFQEWTNGLLFFGKDNGGSNTNSNDTHWIGRVDNAGYHATSGAGGFSSVAGSLAIGAKGPMMFATSAATDQYSSGRMIITTSGNVGIGIDNPQSKLQIENAGEQLRLTYPSIASYIHEVKSNGDYAIDKDGTERLRITSGGYVGINLDANASGNATLTPWTNLHVVGADVADGVSARTNATPTGQLHVSSTGWGQNQGGTISLGSEADNVNPNAAFGSISARRENTLAYQYAGYLAFSTSDGGNLNERLRIGSNGKLSLTGSTANMEYLRMGGNNDRGLRFTSSSGTSSVGVVHTINAPGDGGAQGEIVFQTNSGERLRIDSTGNVGINTANPAQKLDVEGNVRLGTLSAALNFTDSGSTGTRHLTIGADNGGDALLVTHSSGYGVGYFGYEAGGDRLIIACDNGSGNNKIDFSVNAGSTVNGTTDNINGIAPDMRIAASGNVGIGTDNPNRKLVLKDTNCILKIEGAGTAGGYAQIEFKTGSTSSAWIWRNPASDTNYGGESSLNFYQTESAGFSFFTGGNNERLRVDKNGELSISGSRSGQNISDAILKFNIVNSNGDGKKAEIKAIKTADITSELIFSTTVSHTFAERMRIGSTGCLNIGGNFTQTDYTAQVTRHTGNTDVMQIKGNVGNSFIRFTDSDASSDYSLGADDAIDDGFILYDRNANAYRVVVTDTGNVGIGINTPAEKLDVYGSIRSLETGPGNGLLLHTNCGLTASANLMQIWTGQSSGISFHTNSASGDGSNERLRINGSGDVGIGTDNPGAKLEVNGGNARFGRSGLSILVRNAINSTSGATFPATFVACTTDGGTNTALVYWNQNYGSNQNQGCLGAVTATDTIVAPSTSVAYGCTIYGVVGRY